MVWQIIEHSKAVPLLQNSLKRGLMPNAYLIVGPAHVGKMTLAIDLAKALNCEAKEKPCGDCAACQKIAAGKHADVQVIRLPDAVSKESRVKEISVEQIKDMQHASSFPPYEGKFKVFIIDGAEQLSNEAANRLLKTLEEPAENVIYLLLTVNDELLPSTVISRCQHLDLLPLPVGEIEKVYDRKNKRRSGQSEAALASFLRMYGLGGCRRQRRNHFNRKGSKNREDNRDSR